MLRLPPLADGPAGAWSWAAQLWRGRLQDRGGGVPSDQWSEPEHAAARRDAEADPWHRLIFTALTPLARLFDRAWGRLAQERRPLSGADVADYLDASRRIGGQDPISDIASSFTSMTALSDVTSVTRTDLPSPSLVQPRSPRAALFREHDRPPTP